MIYLGIIGAGRMGNAHAKELAQIEGVKIAGVYDIKLEAAQAMQAQHGANIYRSASALAAVPEISGILICSPTYCHLEGIKAAAKAQKAIFCEKPLCRTKAEIREISNLAGKSPPAFMVGFVRRHMAKSKKLKEILESGTLGRIRFCNVDLPFGGYRRMPGDWFADFNLCGGVILDMLAHHIDLANWFFGAPERVYAAGLLMDASQPEPADYVAAVVTYRDNIIVNLMCNWQRFGRSSEMMEIYGDNGAVVMDGSDNLAYYPKGKAKQSIPTAGVSGPQQQMQSFVAAARGTNACPVTLADGISSLLVGLAMIDSVNTQNVVAMRS
ncbi:MAG: Gfo/Idh/MocA family oxidoreductase [Kiritimatiellae bacterium]|nr:Gfo/Idh/MocA family oxidoreductase [Kiritimatiellia bacterium]